MLTALSVTDLENIPILPAKSRHHGRHHQPDNTYREMEEALRVTLEENQKIHKICTELMKENEELRERARQVATVTMLYETAKGEIEELMEQLNKLKGGDDDDSDVLNDEKEDCNSKE